MPTPQVLMRLSPTPSMRKPYPKNLIPLATLLISPIDLYTFDVSSKPVFFRAVASGGNIAYLRKSDCKEEIACGTTGTSPIDEGRWLSEGTYFLLIDTEPGTEPSSDNNWVEVTMETEVE